MHTSLARFCLHQATIRRKQGGKREAGCHRTAEDATMSSTMTYPCWYAGCRNHNCFPSILIHASHKWKIKRAQQLCTWCACCMAGNPGHMFKVLQVKHLQSQVSSQKKEYSKGAFKFKITPAAVCVSYVQLTAAHAFVF